MTKVRLIILMLLVMGVMGGCAKPEVNNEKSPILTDVTLESSNEGSEEKQYVEATLVFDKEVKLASKTLKSLQITIAGERVKDSEYTMKLSDDSDELILTIQVSAVSDGQLIIGMAENSDAIYEITDDSGKYAVQPFTVEALIPSGITLSTVETDEESSDTAKVVKSVDTSWNIRSIAWIHLLENGECVEGNVPQKSEVLDGAIAVHGHDFLAEDKEGAALNIADRLTDYYGEDYRFTCDGNQITVEKLTGDASTQLDLHVHTYLKINGEDVEHEAEAHEHEPGVKIKQTEINRELTDSEKKFFQAMHISYTGEEPYGNGETLYSVLRLTGEALGEEQVYSVKDIETLALISFQNQKMNELELTLENSYTYGGDGQSGNFQGIDFIKFLELCGVDMDEKSLYMACGTGESGQDSIILDLKSIKENWENGSIPILAFGREYTPMMEGDAGIQGPLSLIIPESGSVRVIGDISSIIVGYDENPEDPHYTMHAKEPFSESKDIEFTVNVYQKDMDYLGPIASETFTTEELEKIALENPEHVVRNYYGIIGNEESMTSMGLGGWLDYFEGVDLLWLVDSRVYELNSSGSIKFYGRDLVEYTQIDDLDYLKLSNESSSYTITTGEGVSIPGTIPMIAYGKNGYPLLEEHDHESSGYIAYNNLNQKLESLGVMTEVGVVKNHNGPFVACLGNRQGMYGGYQKETGGDCVQVNIYLDE